MVRATPGLLRAPHMRLITRSLATSDGISNLIWSSIIFSEPGGRGGNDFEIIVKRSQSSRVVRRASARERFKELVLNALVAEKLALKEIAHEPENTSIAEPAAVPATAPDDANGVLVTEPAAEPAAAPDDADGVLVR
jgi:hypothetical protein